MSGWDGRSTFVVFPPFVKGPVGAYVEALFRRRCLGEGVTDVGTVDKEIFGGGNGIKEARVDLVDTVCIGFVEDLDRARTTKSVTDATCLFTTVKCFDIVCPYQVEDRIIRCNQDGVTKHTLGVILIQLEIF